MTQTDDGPASESAPLAAAATRRPPHQGRRRLAIVAVGATIALGGGGVAYAATGAETPTQTTPSVTAPGYGVAPEDGTATPGDGSRAPCPEGAVPEESAESGTTADGTFFTAA